MPKSFRHFHENELIKLKLFLQITYDDICKTYGGSTSNKGYYSSAFAR